MTGGGKIDYYAVLGVPRNAPAPDIRRAYRRVARQHHPDLNRDPGGPERFVAAALAYEVLSDPAARARYDEQLVPHPVPIRRSPSPPTPRPSPAAADRRGVLELTVLEAAHLAHFPLRLTLTNGRNGWIVLPAGTADGDDLVLRVGERLIVLQVRCNGIS